MNYKKKINIIYIVPAHKNASGGSKVIYQHSELINKFNLVAPMSMIRLNRLLLFHRISNKKQSCFRYHAHNVQHPRRADCLTKGRP